MADVVKEKLEKKIKAWGKMLEVIPKQEETVSKQPQVKPETIKK